MEIIVMGFIFGYILSVVFIGIGYFIGISIKDDKEICDERTK